MYYINKTPTENGNYGNPSSRGEIALPDSLLDRYIATMGFAVLTLDGDTVVGIERNDDAYAAYIAEHPAYAQTPAEQREEAYNTEHCISFDGKMLTVTEAAQLWQYYAAEGNDKANTLTDLIASAKEEIREKYKD